MKIKWGSLVVDGRNKIGGHVASKNKFGAYLRTKVTPANPRTTAQIAERSRLAYFAASFKGLNSEQIAAWNDAAKLFTKTDIFGDLRTNTGLQLYVSLNANLSQIGQPSLNMPPAPTLCNTVTLLNLNASATQHTLTLTLSNAIPSNSFMIVKATPQLSPSINFVRSELRKIAVIAPNSTSPIDITNMYAAKYGSIGQTGKKIFVEVYFIDKNTGIASTPQKAHAIIS